MRISDWSSDVCSSDLGIVKPEDAFTGFSDDIVIIVGSALVISAAVQRSGLIEEALALVMRRVTPVRSHLFVLMASVGFASALVKIVGPTARRMPDAFPLAENDTVNATVLNRKSVRYGKSESRR